MVGKKHYYNETVGNFKNNAESIIGVYFIIRHTDESFSTRCSVLGQQERFRAYLNPNLIHIQVSGLQIVVCDISDAQSFG